MLLVVFYPASQGPEPAGDRALRRAERCPNVKESINTINNQPCKRASDGRDFCPPRGAARSSLVPRDLTAEVVSDCPRFARDGNAIGRISPICRVI